MSSFMNTTNVLPHPVNNLQRSVSMQQDDASLSVLFVSRGDLGHCLFNLTSVSLSDFFCCVFVAQVSTSAEM